MNSDDVAVGTVGHQSIGDTIVTEVAALEDTDPLELDTRLYDVVDPDALETLIASLGSVDGCVTFSYYGYEVTVDGDGGVDIDSAGANHHPQQRA